MQSQRERSDLGQQGQSQAWKDPCHSLITCLQIREGQTFRGVRLTSTRLRGDTEALLVILGEGI